MNLSFLNKHDFFGEHSINKSLEVVQRSLKILLEGSGQGNDYLGWLHLPENIREKQKSIIEAAKSFKKFDAVVVIGIGGSYLGSKAVIEALGNPFKTNKPEVIFAGQSLSGDYHAQLLEYLLETDFGVVVISKSGTTIEPAIAFRSIYNLMLEKYESSEVNNRIIAITDAENGALRKFANKNNLKSFIIDDDIGGRFSVLSAVGLLPISIAGYDIEKLIDGASDAKNICLSNSLENIAVNYAAYRVLLYASGYKMELFVNYNDKLNYLTEWCKQLFGESEGKENKGLFPASASFTTDLHSLGQYIQQGEKILFETIINIKSSNRKMIIPENELNYDDLNYLAGKDLSYVNEKAFEGTLRAHMEGKIPNIIISLPKIDEYNLGGLLFFFQISCAISAYTLGFNPFDQPGVEDYKRNMKELLRLKDSIG